MATATPQPYNWSIQAIPAAFAFAFIPHGYYTIRLMQATKGQMSIANPRSNLDTWKGKIPEALYNHLCRVRGAHINSLEVFPLFAAAMIAGNIAKIPAADMNSMALSFFAARALYTGLYFTVTNNTLAYARTGAYAWSIAVPIMGLWRAGKALPEV